MYIIVIQFSWVLNYIVYTRQTFDFLLIIILSLHRLQTLIQNE